MGILDIDGKVMRILGKLADIMELGILVIVCSIPLFTIGASITACYSVTFKMAKNEDGYVFKPFFKAFKENIKKSTALWLIMAVVGSLILADFWALTRVELQYESVQRGILWFLLFLLIFAGNYVFPLQVQYENGIKNTLKNAFFICFINILKSLAAFLITGVPIVMLYKIPQWYPFIIWLGIPATCYFNSIIYVNIFKNYTPLKENKTPFKNEI